MKLTVTFDGDMIDLQQPSLSEVDDTRADEFVRIARNDVNERSSIVVDAGTTRTTLNSGSIVMELTFLRDSGMTPSETRSLKRSIDTTPINVTVLGGGSSYISTSASTVVGTLSPTAAPSTSTPSLSPSSSPSTAPTVSPTSWGSQHPIPLLINGSLGALTPTDRAALEQQLAQEVARRFLGALIAEDDLVLSFEDDFETQGTANIRVTIAFADNVAVDPFAAVAVAASFTTQPISVTVNSKVYTSDVAATQPADPGPGNPSSDNSLESTTTLIFLVIIVVLFLLSIVLVIAYVRTRRVNITTGLLTPVYNRQSGTFELDNVVLKPGSLEEWGSGPHDSVFGAASGQPADEIAAAEQKASSFRTRGSGSDKQSDVGGPVVASLTGEDPLLRRGSTSSHYYPPDPLQRTGSASSILGGPAPAEGFDIISTRPHYYPGVDNDRYIAVDGRSPQQSSPGGPDYMVAPGFVRSSVRTYPYEPDQANSTDGATGTGGAQDEGYLWA
jgi:hypothetical protein